MAHRTPLRGRGATTEPANRYAAYRREPFDDGWHPDEEVPPLRTTVTVDSARRIISYNDSPDVPFDRSINPYRGCEHGCVYCFARPSHAWLDLSPGLDFESRLFYKPRAPELLTQELAAPGYRVAPLALGINTDAYQPVEQRLEVTRGVLAVLNECAHPLSIVTKSALIERDIDLLAAMAARGLVEVAISITTLDRTLARRLEPRAAAPERRLQTVSRLAEAGIPVSVFVAPLIPVLTDAELETVLTRAREAGAADAGYILLRLPREVETLFTDWLQHHAPGQAEHVMNRIRDMRGGKAYDSRFGARMKGKGLFAEMLKRRFQIAHRRLGFVGTPELDCSRFTPPAGPQLTLF